MKPAVGVLVLLCAWPAAGQPPSPQASPAVPALQAGIGIVAAVPQGDFGGYVEGAGGLLGHVDVGLRSTVFSVGGEVGYLIYGNESRRVALGSLIPDIPNATVKVNTDNAMLLLHGRLRAQRRTGRWRPYADALFGFTDLFTKTSIEGPLTCNAAGCLQGNVADATNSRDFVLSYGGGGGMMIGFTRSPYSPRFDASFRYLRGGDARYLTQGAIRREGAGAVLDFSRSRTDMVALYVGIAIGR